MSVMVPFIKMHGLGNDFVVINQQELPDNLDVKPFIKKISDRKLGIGCDQVIVYKITDDQVNMEIYNQDGSSAKACGNASRCITRLIFDQYKKRNIRIKVDDQLVLGEYFDQNKITVDMGSPSFFEKWMPENSDLWNIASRYMIEPKDMICVDVANPHLVIFSKFLKKDMRVIGESLQNSDLFPDGININFASIDNDRIDLRVWERGVGFTHACGSGAVATFSAANKKGFVDNNAEIVFSTGSLFMKKQKNTVLMTGQAEYVFIGKYYYEQ